MPHPSSPRACSLSRRAWLGGTLALACSRATDAPAGASAEPRSAPASARGRPSDTHSRGSGATGPGVAVVELFTSQGCSSCPPADRVLREITTKADAAVLTLSFHVDYWNYLGWADPYSSGRFSARQRSYASRLSGGRVFTPQAIINGRHSALGSAQGEIEDLIRMEKGVAASARVALGFAGGKLTYRVNAARSDLRFSLMVLQRAVHNAVPRGENRGEDLSHVHVVRGLSEGTLAFEGSEGATGYWKPDLAGLSPKTLSAAALISDPSGAIVGAAQIDLA